MNQLFNPFEDPNKKPRRSLTELFKRGKKELGEDDIEKALNDAIHLAEKKVVNRGFKTDLREEIEVTFEQEISDMAFECIESFVKKGVTDLEKTFKLIDGEIYSIDSDVIITPEGLVLPPSLEGQLSLPELTDAKGLEFPPVIQSLELPKVTSLEGVKLPTFIPLRFSLGIETVEGFTVPGFVTSLSLSRLKSAKGLEFSTSVTNIALNGLTTADGLVIPSHIEHISLGGLISAIGLKLPRSVETLRMDRLTTINGLELPEIIKQFAFFKSLSDEDIEELKKKYPQHAEKLRNKVL